MWLRTHILWNGFTIPQFHCTLTSPLYNTFFHPMPTKLPWCQMHGYSPVLLDSGKGGSRDTSKREWVLRITGMNLHSNYYKLYLPKRTAYSFQIKNSGKKKKWIRYKKISRNSLKISSFCLFLLIGLVSSTQQSPSQSRHQWGKTDSWVERDLHGKRPGKFPRRPHSFFFLLTKNADHFSHPKMCLEGSVGSEKSN